MNRNTVLAFVLILLTVWLFQSKFYQERIRGRKPVAAERTLPDSTQEDTSRSVPPGAAAARPPHTDTIAAAAPPRSDGTRSSDIKRDTVWVETDKMRVGIDALGATVVSVRMKDYSYRRGKGPARAESAIELVPAQAERGGASVSVKEEELDGLLFTCADSAGARQLGEADTLEVRFSAKMREGQALEKAFRFARDSYTFGVTVTSPAIAGRNLRIAWPCGIEESEWKSGDKSVQYDARKAHIYDGADVEHLQIKKEAQEERSGSYEWVGVTSKYFLIALIAEGARDGEVVVRAFADSLTEINRKAQLYNHAISLSRTCDDQQVHYRVYAGPMQIQRLRAEGVKLEKVLYGGWPWFLRADRWFPWICQIMLVVLVALHVVVRDYGVAIVLLTIIVKAVTYPLSVSSMRSMVRMKELQPRINAIRERYKSDARKMNEALMELYRENGMNPFNPGCLPMFLQMPVLFSLYVVLRKAIELRGVGTVLVPWVHDLSQAEVLFRLPFMVPFYGDNVALMPIVMGVVTFVQNKATMKDPNQAAMVYVMPVMMLVLFNSFPAGLVLYWTLSSALGLVQQKLMERARGVGAAAEAKAEGGRKARLRG